VRREKAAIKRLAKRPRIEEEEEQQQQQGPSSLTRDDAPPASTSRADMPSSSSNKDNKGKSRAEQHENREGNIEKPELHVFLLKNFIVEKSNYHPIIDSLRQHLNSLRENFPGLGVYFEYASKLNKSLSYKYPYAYLDDNDTKEAMKGLLTGIPYMKENFIRNKSVKDFVDAVEKIKSSYDAK